MKIQELKSQSTIRLFFLGVVTYAIYFVYFLRRLTNRINAELQPDKRISQGFVMANFIFAYLSLAMLVVYVIVPEGHPVEPFTEIIDRVSLLLILIWSFKVRNRLNSILSATPGALSWFHGFWTFLFQYLYINYKINVLSEQQTEKETGDEVSNAAIHP